MGIKWGVEMNPASAGFITSTRSERVLSLSNKVPRQFR